MNVQFSEWNSTNSNCTTLASKTLLFSFKILSVLLLLFGMNLFGQSLPCTNDTFNLDKIAYELAIVSDPGSSLGMLDLEFILMEDSLHLQYLEIEIELDGPLPENTVASLVFESGVFMDPALIETNVELIHSTGIIRFFIAYPECYSPTTSDFVVQISLTGGENGGGLPGSIAKCGGYGITIMVDQSKTYSELLSINSAKIFFSSVENAIIYDASQLSEMPNSVWLMDSEGIVLKKVNPRNKNLFLDTSHFAPGIYYVVSFFENETTNHKKVLVLN